jgi:hypothetical protein
MDGSEGRFLGGGLRRRDDVGRLDFRRLFLLLERLAVIAHYSLGQMFSLVNYNTDFYKTLELVHLTPIWHGRFGDA